MLKEEKTQTLAVFMLLKLLSFKFTKIFYSIEIECISAATNALLLLAGLCGLWSLSSFSSVAFTQERFSNFKTLIE